MKSFDISNDVLHRLTNLNEQSVEPIALLKDVKNAIQDGSLSLNKVVESMGPSLTSETVADRSLGVKFLADTLYALPDDNLNSDEFSLLSSFFCDRLHDHHSTLPGTLLGMLSLITKANVSDEITQKILRSIFRDVHCQSLTKLERRSIYNIFQSCLICKIEALTKMGSEFVSGFISAMDGERDPQNLLLLFSIFPFVTKNLPLDAFAEDMFEVVAAYFPIDFVPPVHDQFGISPEDLIVELRKCLSASDKFAPYCIPLLQEKIESDLISAKVDALKTLASCTESFSASSMDTFLIPLWNAIRKEIVGTSNVQVEKEALSTLSSLIACLERAPSGQSSFSASLQHLADCALMECLGHLSVPQHRHMFTSANILLALSSPSETLTKVICSKVLSLLVGLFSSKHDKSAKKNILEIMAKFMTQMSKFQLFSGDVQLQEDCWQVLHSGLQSSEQTVVIAAASSLSLSNELLNSVQLEASGKLILNLLLKCPKEIEAKKSLTAGLIACGQQNTSMFMQDIIPELLSYSHQSKVNTKERAVALDVLSYSAISPEISVRVVPNLWESACALLEICPSECLASLCCIRKILYKLREKNLDVSSLLEEWSGVINCILLSTQCIFCTSLLEPEPILQELALICTDLIDKDASYIESIVYLVSGIPNESSFEGLHLKKIQDLKSIFESKSSNDRRNILFVYPLSGLLLAPVSIFKYRLSKKVMQVIRDWSLQPCQPHLRIKAAQLFSALVNRAQPDSLLKNYLQDLSPIFESLNDQTHDDSCDPSALVFLLGWLIKALIMRAHGDVLTFVTRLEGLLLSPVCGPSASACYIFLLEDQPEIYKESHGANVKMFYKQRFFQTRIGGLVEQFIKNEGLGKFNTLLAISHLLPYLPQPVIKIHLQPLLPVIIQGLSCKETAVIDGSVSTLCSLMSHSVDQVASHVGCLIPRLFEIYISANLVTRMKCLQCLDYIACLPEITTLPYRAEVIRSLKSPLNDRKRVIRQQAAAAKCRWVLVGSPAS